MTALTAQITAQPRLAQIWRHPIKSIGRERIQSAMLEIGKILPFDRLCAITHDKSKHDKDLPTWARSINYLFGYKLPELQAISSKLNEQTKVITLFHPKHKPLSVNLNSAESDAELLEWLRNIIGDAGWNPKKVARNKDNYAFESAPLISINSLSSLRDLSSYLGQNIEIERWRGNLWIKDLEPWTEHNLIGKSLQIGEAILEIVKPIERCKLTSLNPTTGETTMDMPKALRDYLGHQNFGVFSRVIKAGQINEDDEVKIL